MTRSPRGGDDDGGQGERRNRQADADGDGHHLHGEGGPGHDTAEADAAPAEEGHGEDRRLEPIHLEFIARYLQAGRKVAPAARAVGRHARTCRRWLSPDHPVGALLMREARAVYQTVAEARGDLESLFIEALQHGLRRTDPMSKDKAVEIAGRVLGLDKGIGEHEIGPNTIAVIERVGLALTQAPGRGQVAGVGVSELPPEPGGDALPQHPGADSDPGGR